MGEDFGVEGGGLGGEGWEVGCYACFDEVLVDYANAFSIVGDGGRLDGEVEAEGAIELDVDEAGC